MVATIRRSGGIVLARSSGFREAVVSLSLLAGAAVSLLTASVLSVITSR